MGRTDFTYDFTEEELKSLALVLFRCEPSFSDNLGSFSQALRDYIYESMTIDEAESFFYENF